MTNKEERNKKHLKHKKLFKILGVILLIIGGCLFLSGFFSIIFLQGELFSKPILIILPVIGVICLGIGGFLTRLGFMKEVGTYVKNETAPIINELSDDIEPAIKNVKNAINDDSVTCPNCHETIDKDSLFCDKCGKKIKIECPKCHTINDSDGKFCKKCGEELN